MTEVISVPGKLFLLGEYAVLAGGPALLSTTRDRCVRVRVDGEGGGYRLEGAEFADPLALPRLVADELGVRRDRLDELTVDLGDFYAAEGEKLGLGSSSASTVALVRALRPDLGSSEVAAQAQRIHRRFQGGHGSGADVMACAYEVPLVVRVEEVDPAFEGISLQGDFPGPAAEEVALPNGVQAWGLWTGAPASTTSFMRPVREKVEGAPAEVNACLKVIAEIAARGIEACKEDDAEAFLQAVSRGDEAMEALGSLCDLPIITETHGRLRRQAHEAGCVVKPSGAGGGDFSLLLGRADRPLPGFIKKYLRVSLRLR